MAQSFEKQKLGLGLKKISVKGMRHMIKVLQSLEDPDISHAHLSVFSKLGLHEFRTEPKIVFLLEKYDFSGTLKEWRRVQKWARAFGFHVSHESLLYQPKKGSQKAMQKLRLRFDFDDDLSNLGKGRVVLSNFRCPFECPLQGDSEGNLTYTFDQIKLMGNQRDHNRCTPDIDVIAKTLAFKIAAGVAKHAVARLTKLLLLMRRDQAISLDHVAVHSGNSSEFLQRICEHDMNLIVTHSVRLHSHCKLYCKKMCHCL